MNWKRRAVRSFTFIHFQRKSFISRFLCKRILLNKWRTKGNRRRATGLSSSNSLNKSLNQKWKLKISSKKRKGKIRKLFYEKWIPFQQLRLNPEKKREKTYRIKTNNQEVLIRKENESDATSRWIIMKEKEVRTYLSLLYNSY